MRRALHGMPDPGDFDDERIAALLEGRLPEDQRQLLLAYLAVDESGDHDVLADTAAVLQEIEADDGQHHPTSWRERFRAALDRLRDVCW